MSETMIRVERVSKRYQDRFYALKDVSFSIRAGEVVAIVGRNGAGKSTLLRILSRITWPTEGRVALYGRAGSLLDIGAGFHNGLTGRENIFLSASTLGMSRAETRRRFDEIVAFSGIEPFIDVPVKFYSSGMYLRLAFSIASSVQPDILFIDEALGVGDAEFQRRCRDRIRQIGRSGRTVVFVSHSMQVIPQLTDRAMWLDAGQLRLDGEAHRVLAEYLASGRGIGSHRTWDETNAPGNECVRLRSIRVVDRESRGLDVCKVTEPFGVELIFEVKVRGHIVVPRLEFTNAEGACLFWAFENEAAGHRERTPGCHRATAWLPENLFGDGPISIGVALQSFKPWQQHVDQPNVVTVLMSESESTVDLNTARGGYPGYIPGFVRPLLRWTAEPA